MLLRDAFVHPAAPAVELRAFTHGLMPKTVPAMMRAFVDDWATLGVDAWNEVPNRWRPGSGERVGWWTLPEYLGDHFIGPLLGAPAGTTIHVPNVQAALVGILTSPEVWTRGRRLVTTAGEFPSVLHAAQKLGPLVGFDIDVVAAGLDGFVDPDALLAAASRPGAGLVAVSHVGFSTGERLPAAYLRALAEATHHAGGLFLIDGYHATGSLVIDAPGLGCDLYTGGLLKEACGSSGNAYLYVRDGLALSPASGGWFGDGDPFGFGPSPVPHPSVRRRFLGGTTAVASLYHAVEGVRVLLDAGLANVEQHVAALTARAVERADMLGLRLVTPHDPARRGALLVFDVPEADRLVGHLKTLGVYADARRGRTLRLAPFVWNDADDVDRCFDALAETLRTNAHAGFVEQAAGPVT